MKKIIISAMMVFAALAFIAADVNAQPYGKAYGVAKRQSFYYYPGVNVYFNMGTRQYIYPRNGAWISAPVLPAGFVITNVTPYTVYNYGPNVWAYNSQHIRYYKPYCSYGAGRRVIYKPAPVFNPRPHVSIGIRF
ncbi:MAG TPA: hypothetical protein PL045_13215 [Chitinophagaceae bacterium]|nr:hypothetical protein [Chitinophagaceae bacterium]